MKKLLPILFLRFKVKKLLILTIILCLFAFSAFAADYDDHKTMDALSDVSAAITGNTLIPAQDMNDTDKIGSASVQEIVDKGLEATTTAINGATSLWWRATFVGAFKSSAGGSGATWTAPNGNTLGGYQLNAVGEKLYFNESVTSMWDGASDLQFRVTFESNIDNSVVGADADTIDLQLICYYKAVGGTTIKTQTLEVATTVGKTAQYTRWQCVFTVNWDEAGNVVMSGDKISFVLNLETDTSEVTDIIVNTIMFRYRTAKMNPET